MVHIHDMLDPDLLTRMVNEGLVARKRHPTEPLTILEYSSKAQYRREWNAVTRACRGLVINTDTGQVVARPFPKFFNYGEPDAPQVLSGPVRVTDKLDGSLGILVPTSEGPIIATKGSFTSTQAAHATGVYRDRYHGRWNPNPAWTYLFEVIYPTNRIVLDYADLDDLILLAAIDTATGATIPLEAATSGWPGRVVEQLPFSTMAEALAAPERDNHEGLVVHVLDTDERVKVKYAEYKRLHRILTGCSSQTLWEHLAVDACKHLIHDRRHWGSYLGMDPARAEECLAMGPNWLDSLLDNVPDEFYSWVKDTIADLNARAQSELAATHALATQVQTECGDDRLAMHARVRDSVYAAQVMRLLGGGDDSALLLRVWRQLDPGYQLPFFRDEAA